MTTKTTDGDAQVDYDPSRFPAFAVTVDAVIAGRITRTVSPNDQGGDGCSRTGRHLDQRVAREDDRADAAHAIDQAQPTPYAGLRPPRAEKETIMLLASLPFDYLQHLDRHYRVRRTRTRPTGTRVRRGTPSATGK